MDTNRRKSAALPPLKAAAAAATTSKLTDDTNKKRSPVSKSASASDPTTAASARARPSAGGTPSNVPSRTKPSAPAVATPTASSARRSAQSRARPDDEKQSSDARESVRSSTSASAASASSARSSKPATATRASKTSTAAPISTRLVRAAGSATATKPRATTPTASIKSAAAPTANKANDAASPIAASSPSPVEASTFSSEDGSAERSSEVDAVVDQDAKPPGEPAPVPQAASPRKLEIRSYKSAASLARSRAGSSDNGGVQHRLTGGAMEHEREQRQPHKSLNRHGRAQSEGLQHLSGADRGDLPAEIARLKTDIMRLEQGRNEDGSSSANCRIDADTDDELVRRHAAELDALRAAHGSALEALRESLTAELHSVKVELDSHRQRSSQLDGVERKIEAVQNALRDAKQSEHELQQEVKEKVQDRDQLAKVVEELEQEIDRCQLKLDEDSRLQAQEKEEIRQMSERLQKSLEEEQQKSRAAADKAEKISTELAESQERFKNECQDLKERNEQETEELRIAAADADRLREELNASHESLEHSRNSLQESTSTVKSLKEDVERLKNQQHEQLVEMEMLREQLSEAQLAETGLRAMREREQSDKEELERGTEQDMENLRNQLSKLEREISDNVSTIARLQNESRTLLQQNRELQDQREFDRSHQSQTIREVEEKLQQAESRIEEITSQAVKERETSSSLEAELRSQIAKSQQEHDDTRRSSKESEKAMTRQLAQRQRDLDAAHGAIESNRHDHDSQQRALEEMAMKLQDAAEAKRAAEARIGDATAESATIIDSLQNEAQKLQQGLHDEKGLRSEEQREFHRLRERCKSLEEDAQIALAQNSQDTDELQSTMQARMNVLSESLALSGKREEVAENARAQVETELRESRELVLRLQQSVVEHSERVADLEQLDMEWKVKMSRTLESHAEELEQVRAEGLSQQERAVASVQGRFDALLADKLNLDKQLGEIYMQHNRELEEEEQKHMASYRELQNNYSQLQSALRDRDVGEAAKSDKHDELLNVISTLKAEHERTMAELQRIEQQSQQSESIRASLQSSLEDLKMEHRRALQEMADEHARRMQESDDAHRGELESLQKIAADQAVAAAMASVKEQHERAVAALIKDHQRKMQHMSDSIAEVEAAAIREAGSAAEEQARAHESAMRALKEQHETATSTLQDEIAELRRRCDVHWIESDRLHGASADEQESNAGLYHIFVNHDAEADVEQYGRQLGHNSSINTRAAPREAASGSSRPEIRTSSSAASLIYEDDPFKSPSERHGSTSFATYGARIRDSEDGYGSVLEGTLESLRIQTEQLLDINNDFLAEQRRWSGRLGLVATRVSN